MADSSPRSDNLTQEQSTVSNNHENQNSEAELERLVSPPPQNCCTWYVAAAFLVLLAISLIVTWTMLPAEDIVMKYLPHFDEPENPYLGPEAGDPLDGREDDLDGGEASADDDLVDIGDLPEEVADGNYEIGTTVPTFMRCADGEECCNGSSSNCDLRLNEMMFGMVHSEFWFAVSCQLDFSREEKFFRAKTFDDSQPLFYLVVSQTPCPRKKEDSSWVITITWL
mmetsp:Transcript_778/g.1469  ORF Transcript_778/g.1469 Transcript_778/m.1469 type:complete len:225 (+) Transcript_778:563-1237(+)